VSERILISEHLNLKGGNIEDIINSGPFGPPGDSQMTLEGTLAAARRGIPQGSAASPLIAEIILAIALQAVPKLGDIVAYGDNCLLMAKEENDVVTMMKALETAFQAHPVGLLKPKRKLFKPGEPVDFLGHRLIPYHTKIRIEPLQKRQDAFEWKMKRQLARLKYEKKLSKAKRLRAKRKAIRCIQGWASAFCLCDGIGQYEAHWLTKVTEAYPSSKKKKAICLS
jgi:Reverse transcriptase (RNA-dependent DNA polymerase)